LAGKLEKRSAEKIAEIFADVRINEYYLANQVSSLMTVNSEVRMYDFFERYKEVSNSTYAPNQMLIDLTEYDD
jgi:hypothetical protein